MTTDYSAFTPAHWAGQHVGHYVDGRIVLLSDAPDAAIADCGLHQLSGDVAPIEWGGRVVGERMAGGGVAFLHDAPVAAVRELGLVVSRPVAPPSLAVVGQSIHAGDTATVPPAGGRPIDTPNR